MSNKYIFILVLKFRLLKSIPLYVFLFSFSVSQRWMIVSSLVTTRRRSLLRRAAHEPSLVDVSRLSRVLLFPLVLEFGDPRGRFRERLPPLGFDGGDFLVKSSLHHEQLHARADAEGDPDELAVERGGQRLRGGSRGGPPSRQTRRHLFPAREAMPANERSSRRAIILRFWKT